MSTQSNTCGIGTSNLLPKPGDPNNVVSLTATTARGGIDVSWSFPTVNPHAVAHTRLYRGINNDFSNAVMLHIVAGSIYFDKLNPVTNTQYFYWIKIVSVNGTTGETIGPASAYAKPVAEQTLESLTERIDKGVLATSLKQEIDNIIVFGQQLIAEVDNRIAANVALNTALDAVRNDTNTAMTYLNSESLQRTTENSALVGTINAMAAAVGQNAGAIIEERTVRVTERATDVSRINTLFGNTATNTAAIINEATIRTTNESALAQEITLMKTATADNIAAISSEVTTRTTQDAAITNFITQQISQTNLDIAAAIRTVNETRTSDQEALATTLEVNQSTLNGNIVSAENRMETKITLVDDRVAEIGSLWTAKVSVNGLIGGFGVYNDGREVEAGFDVDLFWVGRTNSNKVKPFIIYDGVVYIDSARIRAATIETLHIGDNAVTVPTYLNGYGGSSHPSNSMVKIASINVNYQSAVNIVALATWQASCGATSTNSQMDIRILGGGNIMSQADSLLGGYVSSHAGSGRAYLGAGSYTLEIWAGNNWYQGSYTLGQWSCTLLGVMK